jgi:hypothetical protein
MKQCPTRQKLVTQNRRFAILGEPSEHPNLASKVLGLVISVTANTSATLSASSIRPVADFCRGGSIVEQAPRRSPQSPPSGFSISTRRTGSGRYVFVCNSFSNVTISSARFSAKPFQDCPSIPGAPLLKLTFLNAASSTSAWSKQSYKLVLHGFLW